MTRLCYFWRVLQTNFLTKDAQILGDIFGYFEERHYWSKNCCGNFFAATFEKMGNFYFHHLVTLCHIDHVKLHLPRKSLGCTYRAVICLTTVVNQINVPRLQIISHVSVPMPVWPEKHCQMSIKVAQMDFTRKMIDFYTFTKIA